MNSPSEHSLRSIDELADTTPVHKFEAYEKLLRSWKLDTPLVRDLLLNRIRTSVRPDSLYLPTAILWPDIVLVSVSSSTIEVSKCWRFDSDCLTNVETSQTLVTEIESALQPAKYPVQMLILRGGLNPVVMDRLASRFRVPSELFISNHMPIPMWRYQLEASLPSRRRMLALQWNSGTEAGHNRARITLTAQVVKDTTATTIL
jgi:hypothetical protein